jgi:NADH-quinone oxidoreductase subunit J
MLEAAVFYILAALLLGFGLTVITRTNPIASALAMVGAFGVLAALYALLSASLVAILQILVYAGGIMVLMVFVIMLLNLGPSDLKSLAPRGFSLVLGLAFAWTALGPIFLMIPGSGPSAWGEASLPEGFGGIFSVGEKLFSDFMFPFEMLSVLLLAAVVGALVLSKKKL